MGPSDISNPSALVAALKSQAPPANPKTLLERLNPDQQALEHIKSASVSLERAGQFTNDPHMLIALSAIGGVLTKALLKFDGQSVLGALTEAVQQFPPAIASAPGAGPTGPQPPPPGGMPQGMQPGAGAPAAPATPPGMTGVSA